MIRYDDSCAAYATDKGQRANNQDSAGFLISPAADWCLLLLADGMGGEAGGEIASRLALESMLQCARGFTGGDAEACLREWVQRAHADLQKAVAANTSLTGMGCTLVAVLLMQQEAITAHVGDSRAYQFRDGCVRRLTEDHLYITELMHIDDREARRHPSGHVLSQAVGMEGELKPAVSHFDLQNGDYFMICCDGVHEVLTEPEMAGILQKEPLVNAVQSMVNAALEASSTDNCTVTAARIPGR